MLEVKIMSQVKIKTVYQQYGDDCLTLLDPSGVVMQYIVSCVP
jgi:hypothetical protein